MGKRRKTFNIELMELLPYVRILLHPKPCDGYRWGKMPMKAIYGPNAKESMEKYRCRRRAFWSYKRLPARKWGGVRGAGKTERYCWSHMPFDNMDEDQRADKWFMAHRNQVDAVRTKYGLRTMAECDVLIDELNLEASGVD